MIYLGVPRKDHLGVFDETIKDRCRKYAYQERVFRHGAFHPVVEHNGIEHKPLQVWTGDYIYIQLGAIKDNPPFSDELKRLEVLHRLNQIPAVAIPEGAVDKYPSIALTKLRSESSLEQFLEALDWVVSEIRST